LLQICQKDMNTPDHRAVAHDSELQRSCCTTLPACPLSLEPEQHIGMDEHTHAHTCTRAHTNHTHTHSHTQACMHTHALSIHTQTQSQARKLCAYVLLHWSCLEMIVLKYIASNVIM